MLARLLILGKLFNPLTCKRHEAREEVTQNMRAIVQQQINNMREMSLDSRRSVLRYSKAMKFRCTDVETTGHMAGGATRTDFRFSLTSACSLFAFKIHG